MHSAAAAAAAGRDMCIAIRGTQIFPFLFFFPFIALHSIFSRGGSIYIPTISSGLDLVSIRLTRSGLSSSLAFLLLQLELAAKILPVLANSAQISEKVNMLT